MNRNAGTINADFLAVGEAYKAIFLPTLDLKGKTFYSSGISAQGTEFPRPRTLQREDGNEEEERGGGDGDST